VTGIYVETLVHAPLDALWEHTQRPDLHEQWDLRFSHIEYLPRTHEAEPQRFRYTTRLGLGLHIAGDGESVGERHLDDGSRSSALTFGSGDPRSLIREGSGYWKYIPTPHGVRFLTWYDYATRHGRLGALLDTMAFRPLIGWATAWSFDRLRLWLERAVTPAQALRLAIAHAVARLTLALVFVYHALVPKLALRHPDEVAMLLDAGVPPAAAETALVMLAGAELVMAACLCLFWRRRWPPAVCIGLMAAATIGVAAASPRYLGAAFNPVSLNLVVAALATIDLIVLPDVPFAGRCRRRPAAARP
jgi:hypothetical protein